MENDLVIQSNLDITIIEGFVLSSRSEQCSFIKVILNLNKVVFHIFLDWFEVVCSGTVAAEQHC